MRHDSRHGGGLACAALAVSAAVLLAGCGAQPQQPAHTASTSAATAGGRTSNVLERSTPTELSIPAIDVHSKLLRLGLNADNSVQVPQMGPDYDKAGWYRYSPTPGERGPSIVLGHIDSAKRGPSVFYRLGKLERGDRVRVDREDDSVATFTIDRVDEYPKDRFPTKLVYGDTPGPTIRLITCGGEFDRQRRSYEDNIVAFGHLTGSRT